MREFICIIERYFSVGTCGYLANYKDTTKEPTPILNSCRLGFFFIVRKKTNITRRQIGQLYSTPLSLTDSPASGRHNVDAGHSFPSYTRTHSTTWDLFTAFTFLQVDATDHASGGKVHDDEPLAAGDHTHRKRVRTGRGTWVKKKNNIRPTSHGRQLVRSIYRRIVSFSCRSSSAKWP